MPDAQRLHRGSKSWPCSEYTHRNVARVLEELNGRKLHQAAETPWFEFGRGFVETVAGILQRREQVSVSITERQLYLDVSGQTFNAEIVKHRFYLGLVSGLQPRRVWQA